MASYNFCKIVTYRALYLVGPGCFPSIFYDVKKSFKNSEYIRENLPGRMELFKLLILKFGDFNLKAHAFDSCW